MVLTAAFAFGQELSKEELKQQKRQIKALMNVAEDAEMNIVADPVGAANAMRTVTSNPLMNNNAYVWFVSTTAKSAVMDNENRKRAEGAAFDEAVLYNYTYEICNDLANWERCDNLPDEKGRVRPAYTDDILKVYTMQFGQFYNAGAYFYGQEDYAKAYDLFATFIIAADKLYNAQIIPKDTTNVPVAAYNTILCAMQMKDYEKVNTYMDLAVTNPDIAPNAFRYKTVATLELGDTAAWVDLCKEGVQKYPTDPYFYQTLIQYYDNRNENDKLNALADELIAADPTNPLFSYLKGYIIQSGYKGTGEAGEETLLDDAIVWYKKALENDPNYETALANLGHCYIQKAQAYSNSQSSTKVTDRAKLARDREILTGFYNEALPIYEKLRIIAPDNTSYWLTGLMNCYYGLKMDKELDELMKFQESLED